MPGEPGASNKVRDDAEYTAVLFFHGMGTPRRYEEISRLTDALDQFAERENFQVFGRLRAQTIVLEPSRNGGDIEDVAYVRLVRIRESQRSKPFRTRGHIRIYESFWSPSATSDYSAWRVLIWFLARMLNPFKVLMRPWRTHQRLKLAWLYRLYFGEQDGRNKELFGRLEKHYRRFENWGARRLYRYGWFSQFRSHIQQLESSADVEHVLRLARRWHRSFMLRQFLLIGLGTTVAVATIDILLGGARLAIGWVELFWPKVASIALLSIQSDLSSPPPMLLFIGTALAFVLGIHTNRLLSDFLADVMYWTIQGEKDVRFAKRRDILRASGQVLTHALADENCKRIVVVAHSLGTAIAHECLMQLGRRFLARRDQPNCPAELQRLNIITHFVTLACPIERIHYFFELQDSKLHRYNRIREEMRGDTGQPPFTLDGLRSTEWLNIWDDADPISGPLYSPRKHLPNRLAIQDVKVMSSFRPNFISAHTDYFFSLDAMREIFSVIAFGSNAQVAPRALPSIAKFLKKYGRPAAWSVALFLPWSILPIAWLWKAAWLPAQGPAFIATSLCVCVLILLNVFGFWADRISPIRTDISPWISS